MVRTADNITVKREHPLAGLSYERELKSAATKLCTRTKKRIIVSRRHGRKIYRTLRKAIKHFTPKFKDDINVVDLVYQRRYMRPTAFQLKLLPGAEATMDATEEEEEVEEAPMGVAPGKISKKKRSWSPETASKLVLYTSAIIKVPLGKGGTMKKWATEKPTGKPGRSPRRRLYMVFAWRAYKGKDIIFPLWIAKIVMKRLRLFPKKIKKKFTVKLRKVGNDEYRVIVKRRGKAGGK